MEIGFIFEVLYRDDDLIEVRVSAWNGAFGGSANVYLGMGRLGEMAEQLRGFPSSIVDSREAILGAFGPEFAGGGVSPSSSRNRGNWRFLTSESGQVFCLLAEIYEKPM